jgi:type IV pilus assembly protein PilW
MNGTAWRSAPVRGFTITELLVTMAVSGFAIAAVLGTFASQQRSFESAESARSGQEAAREGLLEMERSLRMLGFGVDPRYAFDFRTYRCAAAPCRDKIDAPDELVFMARDPAYRLTPAGVLEGNAWVVVSAAPTFTVQIRTGQRFRKGQVLFVSCAGASRYTMATVGTTTDVATADGNQNLDIMTAVAGDPYRENNYADACYGVGTAMAFTVNRYRYFIETVDNLPWLMLDTGIDLDGDNVTPDTGDIDDIIPVARGVEDIQVAYTLRRSAAFTAPDNNTNWIIGDTPGTVEEPDPTIVQPSTYPYRTTSVDAAAYNLHPGNIRQIRVTLMVRSPRQDNAPPPSWLGDAPPWLNTAIPTAMRHVENRNAGTTSLGRLRRYPTITTVNLRNMGSRSPFVF